MKAVILAAGKATRFGGLKPLAPLFGIPIIEHTIRGLHKIDVRDVAIVYNDKRIKEYLEKKYPEIKFIHNPHPERENGYSAYLAKEFANGPFILVMADHYYSSNFFSFFKNFENMEFEGCVIFVSKEAIGPEEATKVKVKGNKVVKIGKNLENYDYFDTGMFYCTPEIFNYGEKLLSHQIIKLSDIMNFLARDGKLHYQIIEGFWIDIDTKEELKIAEKEIEKSMMKKGDGYISKLINRKISIRITKMLAPYNFATPNFLTLISFLFGLISFLLFFLHHPVLGGIMTQLTSIVDGCDGEMARLKKLQSKFGASFDAISDRYVDIILVLGILANLPINQLTLLSFFFAVTGVILFSYAWHLTQVRIKFGGRDMRLFLIFLFALLSPFAPNALLLSLLIVIGGITHVSVILSLLKLKLRGE